MKTLRITLAAACMVCSGNLARSQTAVLPDGLAAADGSSLTSYPWARHTLQIRVQNLYDSTNLTNQGIDCPIVITGVEWRADSGNGAPSSWPGGTYGNVEVTVGGTTVDYAAMSATFSANWTGGVQPPPSYAGPVTVLGGTSPGGGAPGPYYVAVSFPPVCYDPTSGEDLMIEIASDGSWSGTSKETDVAYLTELPRATRVYNFADWRGAVGTLQTQIGQVVRLSYLPCGSLCTVFAANNGGAIGGAFYFDVTVTNPSGITVRSIDTNFGVTAGTMGVGLDVYCRPGTAFGNESSLAGWSLVAQGTGTAAGPNVPTRIDVGDFALAPGLWGIALVAVNADHDYTNGNGANQAYEGCDFRIDNGSATNTPFAPGVNTPRVWNGCIHFDPEGALASWTTRSQSGCLLDGSEPSVNLAGAQIPVTGSTWTFEVRYGPANGTGLLALGLTQVGVPFDLGLVGGPAGCALGINPIPVLAPVPLNAHGYGTWALDVGHNPNAHGVTLLVQGLAADFSQPYVLPIFASDTYAALVGSN